MTSSCAGPPCYILVSHSPATGSPSTATTSTLSHPEIEYHYADDSPHAFLPQYPGEHVVVLDFNFPAMLRNAQRETDDGEDENEEVEDKTLYSRDMIHPSTIEANYVFSVDVTTSIPYRIA